MDNFLFFILLGTMIAGFSLLCKLIRDSVSSTRSVIKDASTSIRTARKGKLLKSDQLYAEFIELLKNTKK